MRLRIKELMDERDPRWTFERLAEESDLSISVLSRLNAGDRRFHQDHIEALAKAFKVEPAELFEGSHTEPQQKMIRELFFTLSPEDRELAVDQMKLLLARRQSRQEQA